MNLGALHVDTSPPGNLRFQILSAPGQTQRNKLIDLQGREKEGPYCSIGSLLQGVRPMTKFYIDQIEELAAESVKAASLTPLQADESAPLSRREAVRGEGRANVSSLADHRGGDISKRST